MMKLCNTERLAVVIMVIVAILSLASIANAAHGTATFYTPPYTPSACDGNKNEGVMIAAASDAIWQNGAACGRKYKVTCTGATNKGPHPCTGKSVVVKIVDFCPSGCQGTIDLSQEAFAIIGNPDSGKIKINFHQV